MQVNHRTVVAGDHIDHQATSSEIQPPEVGVRRVFGRVLGQEQVSPAVIGAGPVTPVRPAVRLPDVLQVP